MAEVSAVARDDKKAVMRPMAVMVAGRIENSRSYDGRRYTQVLAPAVDAYSRPQVVEIRSRARLGERGEEIAVQCMLGGFQRRAYEAKDKSTGEIVRVVPIEHTLDAIETGA
ncbi:single-stranded DNA-binding protein [Pigmentiphaga sp.]|uniref:single-stranded DNA-binding protein n=1 Tax=Pigmentiphaga sp. TaxID=1977564 RepID=UPI0025DD4271|nr:single-stranded DNA-binding protein [Pigmentiphaga sp.]